MGGPNEIANNKRESYIRQVNTSWSNLTYTQVTVGDTPYRCDQPYWSKVNKQISLENKTLHKIWGHFRDVNISYSSNLRRMKHANMANALTGIEKKG